MASMTAPSPQTDLRFVVDSADHTLIEQAHDELHALLEKDTVEKIPLLVVGNKNDLEGAYDVDTLIKQMGLDSVKDRPVACYSISVKEAKNLNAVLSWLVARSR